MQLIGNKAINLPTGGGQQYVLAPAGAVVAPTSVVTSPQKRIAPAPAPQQQLVATSAANMMQGVNPATLSQDIAAGRIKVVNIGGQQLLVKLPAQPGSPATPGVVTKLVSSLTPGTPQHQQQSPLKADFGSPLRTDATGSAVAGLLTPVASFAASGLSAIQTSTPIINPRAGMTLLQQQQNASTAALAQTGAKVVLTQQQGVLRAQLVAPAPSQPQPILPKIGATAPTSFPGNLLHDEL